MKIFVTGGAGFIGSNLVDRLIDQQHEVIVIDNLSSGSKDNLNPKTKLYLADICNYAEITRIFETEKPQIVYHLAAQIDVRKSVEDPIFDAQTNILAGINLIQQAYKNEVQKFIFSSTGGAIYGETTERPTTETHPENPLSPYGIAKLAIDKYLNYYYQVFGLKYTSLRYGNVYGPRQNPHGEAGVVSIFLKKMLNQEQPVIYGDGSQTRDYVFVSDVVDANIQALNHLDEVGVYNIGTGMETSVNELFDTLNQNFDQKYEKQYAPARKGEQQTSCLNNSKSKNYLQWEPKTNLVQGLAQTFEWFKLHVN